MPSTSTVQQPHSPWPQLSRAPNRSKRCNNSTRLRCGSIAVETASPLSVKLMVRALIIGPSFVVQRTARLDAQGARHRLRRDRQFRNAPADGAVDGVGDPRRRAEGARLAKALGAERSRMLLGRNQL